MLRFPLVLALAATATATAADWPLWTTTALGAGADATIHNQQPNQGGAKTVAVRNNQFPTHHMKIYLRFDLRRMQKVEGFKTAGKTLRPHLVLQLAGKPDADHEINVFGLIERKSYGGSAEKPILGFDWSEKELTYDNAPAFSPYGGGKVEEGDKKWEKGMLGGVNHEHVVQLATFTVKKDQEGEVAVPLPEFTAFAEKHVPSRVATLILTRVTETVNATSFHSKESAAAGTKAPKLAFGL